MTYTAIWFCMKTLLHFIYFPYVYCMIVVSNTFKDACCCTWNLCSIPTIIPYLKPIRQVFSNIGAMFYHICPVNSSWNLQDFTLDMYFRQFWRDPRLSFERRIGLEKLVVGAEYIKLIWVPDTFFVNEKTAYFHDATTENQFLRILHTGEILRSIRWVK